MQLLGIKYEVAVLAVDFVIFCRICLCDTWIKIFHEIRHELHSVERHLLRFKHSSRNKKKKRFGMSAIKRFVRFS